MGKRFIQDGYVARYSVWCSGWSYRRYWIRLCCGECRGACEDCGSASAWLEPTIIASCLSLDLADSGEILRVMMNGPRAYFHNSKNGDHPALWAPLQGGEFSGGFNSPLWRGGAARDGVVHAQCAARSRSTCRRVALPLARSVLYPFQNETGSGCLSKIRLVAACGASTLPGRTRQSRILPQLPA